MQDPDKKYHCQVEYEFINQSQRSNSDSVTSGKPDSLGRSVSRRDEQSFKLSIIYQNSRSKVNVEDDVELCRPVDVFSEHVHWHTDIKLVGRGLSFYHAKLADMESEKFLFFTLFSLQTHDQT